MSDPLSPIAEHSHDIPIISLLVRNGIAYASVYDSGFQIIDVSNPSLPVTLATYGPNQDFGLIGLSSNTAYLFDCSDWIMREQLFLVDVSNPSSPVQKGSFITDEFYHAAASNDLVGTVNAMDDTLRLYRLIPGDTGASSDQWMRY